jgi:hypothetical protein
MNKYLFAGIGSLVMTALLFSFVIVLAGGASLHDINLIDEGQRIVAAGSAE